MTTTYRTEKDSMGPVQVPADALYGAQTMRAVENFPVSGIPFPRSFIRALGLIKLAAAQVNQQLGHLEPGHGWQPSCRPHRRWPTAAGTPTSPSTSSRPAPAPRPT